MKTLIKFLFLVALAVIPSLPFTAPTTAYAAGVVENWWPTEGAQLSGVHPFKALLKDVDIKNYVMYWQVDNGQLNKMEDNYTDYPHKEVSVDLSGWNWKRNNSYTINFVAKDLSGNTLAQKSVRITVKSNTSTTTTTPTTPTVTAPTTPTTTVQVTAPAVTQEVQVQFPLNNSSISGANMFKALVTNTELSNYKMYWQVDGDRLNEMTNSTVGNYKEARVDVTYWTWKPSNEFTITFVAKNLNGTEIGRKDVVINRSTGTVTPVPTTPVVTTPTSPTPTTTVTTTSSNPFAGVRFYVNPNSNAKRQADLWRTSRPTDAAMMDKIAGQPDAKWVGNWNTNVYADVKAYVDQATAAGTMPVLIAYNIPSRDCGSYSAGGAANAENYKTWIRNVADGIGSRKAAVILEPDALAGITCLDGAGQASRISLLKDAVTVLKAKGNVVVYIDAGHSNWVSVEEMSSRLKNSGIDQADGFALNVSNYQWTNDNVTYGTRLSALVGGKHFVIDTSRNGQGPLGSEWCNPSGRGLGKSATSNTGNSLVDAFMWLKNPGESDGTCNGGPSAGVWWPEYALGLAQRAEF